MTKCDTQNVTTFLDHLSLLQQVCAILLSPKFRIKFIQAVSRKKKDSTANSFLVLEGYLRNLAPK